MHPRPVLILICIIVAIIWLIVISIVIAVMNTDNSNSSLPLNIRPCIASQGGDRAGTDTTQVHREYLPFLPGRRLSAEPAPHDGTNTHD